MENPNQPQINPTPNQNPDPNPEAYQVPHRPDQAEQVVSAAQNIMHEAIPQPNPTQQPNIPHPMIKPRPKTARTPQLGMGCLIFAVVFIILAIISVVIIMAQGNGNNALTQSLGITATSLKTTLTWLTSGIFGLFTLALLVLTVILAFKRTVIPAIEKELRQKALKNIIISAVLFIFTLFTWIMVYLILSQLQVEANYKDIIATNPTVTTQLTGPIDVTFSAENIANIAKNRGLTVAQCEWDFDGDSRIDQSGCQLTYTYEKVGQFNVGVNVYYTKNGEKQSTPDLFTKLVTVENIAPKGVLTAAPTSGKAPLEVVFDATDSYDSNGTIKKVEWLFEDNGQWTAGELTAQHTYNSIGEYDASLRLTDNNGAITTVTQLIKVEERSNQDINAIISTTPAEPTGTVPFQIRFDASQSTSPFGKITSYRWDFGDGTSSQSGRSVSRKYLNGGEYTVTLTVEDEKGNKATDSVVVKVDNPAVVPNAKITTNQEISRVGSANYIQGTVPYTVQFSAKDSTDQDNNIVYYGWDFNDDGNYDEEGENVEHTFLEAGNYNVVLTVVDADEQSSTDELEVHVNENSLRPHIETEPGIATGPAPFTVAFDASASEYESGDILSYEWDFDDGTQPILGDAQVTHIFNVVGDYDVKMTIYTNDNKQASITKRVVVRNVPLKAKIVPSVTHGPAPLKITFDPSESTGSIRSYAWDFGDNTNSTQVKPAHTYEKPGTYEVKLTVTDNSNNLAATSYTIIVED